MAEPHWTTNFIVFDGRPMRRHCGGSCWSQQFQVACCPREQLLIRFLRVLGIQDFFIKGKSLKTSLSSKHNKLMIKRTGHGRSHFVYDFEQLTKFKSWDREKRDAAPKTDLNLGKKAKVVFRKAKSSSEKNEKHLHSNMYQN